MRVNFIIADVKSSHRPGGQLTCKLLHIETQRKGFVDDILKLDDNISRFFK